MNDSNTICGCQDCVQGCQCGCQVNSQAEIQTPVCACGESCDCNPCRCADAGQ